MCVFFFSFFIFFFFFNDTATTEIYTLSLHDALPTSSKFSVSCGSIANRAVGFGMPGKIVDGHDFFAVYEAAGEAIERARNGDGPSLLEFKLNRYYGHFEGDAQTYRGKDEVKKLRDQKDCLTLFRRRVGEAGLLEEAEFEAVDAETRDLIER